MQTIIITAVITAALCAVGFVSYAQTFSEWWRQKKTRVKYLHQQLAALNSLKATLEEGNSDAEKGIDEEDIEMMLDFKQAEAYLTSLGYVKTIFRNNYDINSTCSWAKVYTESVEKGLAEFSQSPWLSESELRDLKFELHLVKDDLQVNIKNLRLLITDGKVTMEDGERWEMINGIEHHVVLIGKFLWMMTASAYGLIETREQQGANDEYLKNNLP